MKSSSDRDEDRARFDRGCSLRDLRQLEEALSEFQLIVKEGKSSRTLIANSWLQIGYISEMLGDEATREHANLQATQIAPRMELASIGLFHALFDQGRLVEALTEAMRFLSLRDSEAYRELLCGDGFRDDVSAEIRALADRARNLLAKHSTAN